MKTLDGLAGLAPAIRSHNPKSLLPRFYLPSALTRTKTASLVLGSQPTKPRPHGRHGGTHSYRAASETPSVLHPRNVSSRNSRACPNFECRFCPKTNSAYFPGPYLSMGKADQASLKADSSLLNNLITVLSDNCFF